MARDTETLEKMNALEERIKAPSYWGRVPSGVRFEDLQDKRYEEAVRFLKKHYLPEEITYKSVKLAEDKEATDEFIHNARIWMKDKMSIAAVKEGTDKLVGVLIMRIQEKKPPEPAPKGPSIVKECDAFSRTFSRVKLTYNPLYSSVMKFFNTIEKPVDVFEELKVRRYFKVYVLALKQRYRHRGIGKELLKAAVLLSESASVPAIAGIFTTNRLQEIATELGYKKLNEIYYIRYLIDGEVLFWDTGLGNYGAAMMAHRIPNIEEPQEVQVQHSSRFKITPMDDEDENSAEGADQI